MTATIIIPFRDRGNDLRRGANLEVVLGWWWLHGFRVYIQSDGLSEHAPFNRHKAYNYATARFPETDVFVFAEADMLIQPEQVHRGIGMAMEEPGLVVPFTEYRYLSDETTVMVRDEWYDGKPELFIGPELFALEPESVMSNGRSIGAINIVSRETLEITGGFTEATSGNWYDDNIIEEGFTYLTKSKTRFVEGPALHMYHLPGWKGDHLTAVDKNATKHNRRLLDRMRLDIMRGDDNAVRRLMTYRSAMR